MKATLDTESTFLVFIANLVFSERMFCNCVDDKRALAMFALTFFLSATIINFLFF